MTRVRFPEREQSQEVVITIILPGFLLGLKILIKGVLHVNTTRSTWADTYCGVAWRDRRAQRAVQGARYVVQLEIKSQPGSARSSGAL